MIREQRAKKYGKIQLICCAAVLVLLFVATFLKMESDFIPMFKWWLALLALGVSFYPLSAVLFGRFSDKGYIFGKAIGLLITGLFVWLLCTIRLVQFNETTCWICLQILTAANYVVIGILGIPRTYSREGKGIKSLGFPVSRIMALELMFVIIFFSFMYMKGFNPKAYGTEKMMDYGMMTRMFNTDYYPVNDMWFTGEPLNYYYFGQYLCTFLTKLSLNIPAYGYNLAIGSGFALCCVFVYCIGTEIMRHFMEKTKKYKHIKLIPHVAGALSAGAVMLASSLYYLVFAKFVPMMWDILQIEGEKPSYWFPNATRYIGHLPDTADKGIHEFPAYSFILGDLHAHVINLTFVLVVVALLFSIVKARRIKRDYGQLIDITSWKRYIFDPKIITISFFIGAFMMINFWDFPIYFVVAASVIIAMNMISTDFSKAGFMLSGAHLLLMIAIAELAALPFNIFFKPMENGILMTTKHTEFYQLFILWGIPVLTLIGFVVSLICKHFRQLKGKLAEYEEEVVYDEDDKSAQREGFWGFFTKLADSDLFVLILGICAFGLVLLPEIIYVKDIYGDSYQRANTMFKLTYQAFILFGIMAGYAITKMVALRETRKQLTFGLILGTFWVISMFYFPDACKAWFTDLSDDALYAGLRADNYIYSEQPTDAAAIDWLKENADGNDVVLEAAGSSYSIYARVSTLTGMPTVCGWYTHEWLWHNDFVPVNDRNAEVMTMYTSRNEEEVRALLNKYSVDYIFIGTCEYEAYEGSGMNLDFLLGLGEVVYQGYPDERNHVVYVVKLAN
ncbi:MAG: hypothetical protein KBS85_05685 [Lachnospiraceae bacterium]|nr:hypothetical protein [Candidatus Merdinaster equi]